MRSRLALGTILLASLATTSARADLLHVNPSFAFDTGAKPVLAVGTTPYGAWEIEVHQGGAGLGTLWYSSGRASGAGVPSVGNAFQFDVGYAPAIATISPTSPLVIEVHQGQTEFGPLLYSIGKMTSLSSPNTIAWTASSQYDNGYAPSVASLNQFVLEVHQGQTGSGPLWFKMGKMTSSSGVAWNASGAEYDNGEAPSVAMAATSHGQMVVEVHQGGDGFGPLWYRTGRLALNSSGPTVQWNNSAQYDSGSRPSVALYGDRVIEVHQGSPYAGPLWYRTGVINGTGIVWDQTGHQYDSGFMPAVAFDPVSIQGYELHQTVNATSSLMTDLFTTSPVVPTYPQLESQWCWIASAEMAMQSLLGDVQDNNSNNDRAGAQALECNAANLREHNSGSGWGQNGAYVNCSTTESWRDTSGCDHGGLTTDILDDHGFTYSYANGTPVAFSLLQGEIASGRPVTFAVNWNNGTGGHVMVVAGTEVDESGKEWVLVNDPGSGEQVLYSYAVWGNTDSNSYTFTITDQEWNLTAP
jgi:hypothetical protein